MNDHAESGVPPGQQSGIKSDTADVTYPLTQKIQVNYSAYEDRLVVSAERRGAGRLTLLLTRRMTMLMLQQMVEQLPSVSGLDKTPAEYWQEVLQMAHQRARAARAVAKDTEPVTTDVAADVRAASAALGAADERAGAQNAAQSQAGTAPGSGNGSEAPLYLATALTLRPAEGQLTLAFRGLPLPEAITEPRQHAPVMALPLDLDNVHQLLELLMGKAQEAQWHLSVDLPWMEAPADVPGRGAADTRTH